MRAEKVLWWLATSCALLILLAPLAPRTTWLPTSRNAAGVSRITEGVGWQGIAALLGSVALLVLVVGLRARTRIPAAAASAAVASIAFGVIAVGMARHWIDLMNGVASVYPGEGWVLHPAPLVPVFAVLAAAGAGFALVVTILWLQPATGTGTDSSSELPHRRGAV